MSAESIFLICLFVFFIINGIIAFRRDSKNFNGINAKSEFLFSILDSKTTKVLDDIKESVGKTKELRDTINKKLDQDFLLVEDFRKHHFVEFRDSTTECDKCGCLLDKATAYKKSYVVEITQSGWLDPSPNKEVIKHKYYCKIHKPKTRSKK